MFCNSRLRGTCSAFALLVLRSSLTVSWPKGLGFRVPSSPYVWFLTSKQAAKS